MHKSGPGVGPGTMTDSQDFGWSSINAANKVMPMNSRFTRGSSAEEGGGEGRGPGGTAFQRDAPLTAKISEPMDRLLKAQ